MTQPFQIRYDGLATAMKISRTKKLFFLGVLIALSVAAPLTVYLAGQKQTIQSSAHASTTLSFTPASTTTSPLRHAVNDLVPLTISLTPGSNLISVVSLEILYDQSKLEPAGAAAFTPNTNALPRILEGPVYSPGRMQVSLSIGTDPSEAIRSPTTIGTITFKALTPSASPVSVSFGSNTQAFSIAGSDQPSENVLSTTTPSFISVDSTSSVDTPPASPENAAATPLETVLNLTIFLDGIGSAPAIPTIQNNKTPLHQSRSFTAEIFDSADDQILSLPVTLKYTTSSGAFQGVLPLPNTISKGKYSLKVKTNGYLKKRLPLTILQAGIVSLPPVSLVAGDSDNDNALTVLDYGMIHDCWSGEADPLPISSPKSQYNDPACKAHAGREYADLNDDGFIDQNDYNLYLKEVSIEKGD